MDKNQKLIAIIAGSVGVLVLYFIFLYQPILKNIKTLESTLKQKENELQEAKIQALSFDKLKEKSIGLKKELFFVLKRMPVKSDDSGLLKEINSCATEVNIINSLFQKIKPVVNDKFVEHPFTLDLEATYHSLGNFINNLSYLEKLIVVKDIQLASSSGSKYGTVKVKFSLSSYISRIEEALIQGLKGDGENQIIPLFVYDESNKRDPFQRVTLVEASETIEEVNISTLRLTGIIHFEKKGIATLEDDNMYKYILKNKKLYSNNKIVKGVTGDIEGKKVVLKQQDSITGKLKNVVLEFEK